MVGQGLAEEENLELLGAADVARDQAAKHSQRAEALAQKHRDFTWGDEGPVYVAPTSDDPMTWRGIAAYVFILWRYEFHIEAIADLRVDERPHHCPECDGRPAKAWRGRLCLPHAWEAWGYDDVLARARDLDPRRLRRAEVAA